MALLPLSSPPEVAQIEDVSCRLTAVFRHFQSAAFEFGRGTLRRVEEKPFPLQFSQKFGAASEMKRQEQVLVSVRYREGHALSSGFIACSTLFLFIPNALVVQDELTLG